MTMNIIALEALTFGLGRLAEASKKYGCSLTLLTRDKTVYSYELSSLDERLVKVVEIDTFDNNRVVQLIRGEGDAVALLSSTDTWSLHCLDVSGILNLHAQNPDAIRIARDKFQLRNRLFEAGLSSVRSILADPKNFDKNSLAENFSFPCIIKDSAGTGSQNVWVAYSEEELLKTLVKADQETIRGKIVIEPFFSGTLYSLETISWKGETRVIALTSRVLSQEPYFREEAFSSPVTISDSVNEALDAWIKRILHCIGYDNGFAHTEFMITSNGFEVIEINPRLGGVQIGEALCQSFSINIYEAWIEMALNRRPNLLDAPLESNKGIGQLIVYATEAGEFSHIEGVERLNAHPGRPKFYPTAYCGKKINTIDDQRASIGILLAEGETSEIALLNAFAARNKIRVIMKKN
ncbi:Uncharacterized protein ALO36_02025 [Pseudomonas syringae pv. tomato]|nr:Uncharacterized protein ALO36_02025 [Pseudomonas syringae pv. tomato]RMM14690.1 hypothetical protein ALQ85_01628 [Pseudomonas syringae]